MNTWDAIRLVRSLQIIERKTHPITTWKCKTGYKMGALVIEPTVIVYYQYYLNILTEVHIVTSINTSNHY